MAEFTGDGFKIGEYVNGGTVFEIVPPTEEMDTDDKQTEKLYLDNVEQYINFSCLNAEKEIFDNNQPFEAIAATMVDLTEDGKVKKRVVKEGYGGNPVENNTLALDYNAYVEYEAVPFDSTYARKQQLHFTLNGEGLIGFQIAVRSMKVSEKSLFLIHPDLAYKECGLKRIPKNATILFEIEVHSIFTERDHVIDKSWDAGYKYCSALSAKAKEAFSAKDYRNALHYYGKASRKLDDLQLKNYDEQLKKEEFDVKIRSNMLVCCTILKIPKYGCFLANYITDLAKNGNVEVSAKVFFNKAKCLKMLHDFEKAEEFYKVALRKSPNDKHIKKALTDLQEQVRRSKEQEEKMAKAIFRF